jgi:ribosome-associated protein
MKTKTTASKAKKSQTKKVVTKKVTASKAATKKAVLKKAVTKKAVVKKVAVKKPVTKKTAAKKVEVPKTVAKKAPRKVAAKKVVSKKTQVPKRPVKKMMSKAVAKPVTKKKVIRKVPVEKIVPKKEPLPECVVLAANILFQLRAERVQLLDLRGINDVADFYLIGSCGSEAQMQAILNELTKEYKAKGIVTNGVEYKSGVQWAVLDAGLDLMVHLFEQTKRDEIALDILYRDGKVAMLDEKDFITKTEEKKAKESNDFI